MKIVSNGVLQDWLQVTKAKGHDLKALLSVAEIPWDSYENSSSSINGEQLSRLNSEIRRLLDDQFMGYGQATLSPALLDRVLIKILAQAKDVQEMLLEWENFYNLVQGSGSIVSGLDRKEFVYRFKFKASQPCGSHVWFLDSTMLKLQLFSWLIGKKIKLKAIGFAEPASAGADQYSSLLSAETFFGQSQNFFSIDKEHLKSPVIRTADECLDYKKYLPRDFFVIPCDARRFVERVERTMRALLRTESRLPKIEWVAEKLSVSARGLRRKLEAEGESFQNLKNRTRQDLAIKRLASSDIPLEDIAAELGFSGAMAFTRAFKGWTKKTPQEYREQRPAN
jgi:AraC-like DNA-binding protein